MTGPRTGSCKRIANEDHRSNKPPLPSSISAAVAHALNTLAAMRAAFLRAIGLSAAIASGVLAAACKEEGTIRVHSLEFKGVRGIEDQPQPTAAGESRETLDVGGTAPQVNRQNRRGPFVNPVFDVGRTQIVRGGIDITEGSILKRPSRHKQFRIARNLCHLS